MLLKDVVPQTLTGGARCSVGELIKEMDASDTATLNEWLVNPELSTASIARALTDTFPQHFSPSTVARHRRRECRCGG